MMDSAEESNHPPTALLPLLDSAAEAYRLLTRLSPSSDSVVAENHPPTA